MTTKNTIKPKTEKDRDAHSKTKPTVKPKSQYYISHNSGYKL